jgi:hypothetical protein
MVPLATHLPSALEPLSETVNMLRTVCLSILFSFLWLK